MLVADQLPERVPIHGNLAGEADASGRPLVAVPVLPVVAAFLWLFSLGAPRLDPWGAYAAPLRLYLNTTVLFLAGLHAAVLGNALGWDVSVPRLATAGTGLLLAVIGNELGRVQPNWVVGIRTPWTLSDPEVWRRTHRVGGRVLFVAGLLIAAAALVLPPAAGTTALIAGCIGIAVAMTAYSYMLSRRLT